MADNQMYFNNGTTNGACEGNMTSHANISFPDIDPGYTYPEIDPDYTYPDINGPVAPDDGRSVDPGFTYPTPSIPGTPTVPSVPVIPGTPTVPSVPVIPGTPTVPSIPVIPGTPTVPSIPVIPGTPTVPSIPNFPVIPLPPIVPPTCPNCPPITPSPQYYGQVRFLNASTMTAPVNISIDGNNYAINSRFGTITNYDWISDGFHTVTVRSTNGMRNILLQQTYPFAAGEKTTIILVDVGAGLDLVKVVDTGCNNLPANTGCYRVANMSFSGSSFDIVLYGGDTVFRGITFQNVSSYKQAIAGSYQFYVANSGSMSVIREMPVIVIGNFPGTGMVNEPLLSYQADIEAGRNFTTYLIGNSWSEFSFRALTVMD